MAKLLRHLVLGAKKYPADSSQQDHEKPDENVRHELNSEWYSSTSMTDLNQSEDAEEGNSVPGLWKTRVHGGSSCSGRPSTPVANMGILDYFQKDSAPKSDVPTRKTSRSEEVRVLSFVSTSLTSVDPTLVPNALPTDSKKPSKTKHAANDFSRKAFRKRIDKSSISAPITSSFRNVEQGVLVQEDYSDPADFCSVTGPRLTSSSADPSGAQCPGGDGPSPAVLPEDDYVEPFNVRQLSKGSVNSVHSSEEFGEDTEDAYDEVCESKEVLNEVFEVSDSAQHPQLPDDCRPGDEYDVPWEWGCPGGRRLAHLHPAGAKKASSSSDSSVVSETSLAESLDSVARHSEGDDGGAMTGRQRRLYETAFDSTVAKADDDDGEMVQHPILTRNDTDPSKNSSPKGGGAPRTMVAAVQGLFTPKEHRKVTLVRDPSRASEPPAKATEHRVRAIVHLPPRSANSTPTLSYRAKEGLDSCASSAKSTPTHFLSKRHPLRQFSDITLNDNQNLTLNKSTASMPPASTGRLDGSDRRLPTNGAVSSEESVASSSSSSSNNNSRGSRGSIDNHREPKPTPLSKFQRHLQNLAETDGRPVNDYDPPWDLNHKLRPTLISDALSAPTSLPVGADPPISKSVATAQVETTDTSTNDVIRPAPKDQPWASNDSMVPSHPPNRHNFQLPVKIESAAPSRSNLTLNLNSQSPKRKRNNLQLNFGCSALSVMGETVDPTIPLERQGWYHGAISRTDAENLLRLLQEGCYLVRNSESSKQDYSLSLKSARGFMHMKIVFSDGKYILGQFSKPFNSIPDMIHHYSINKLPIKGAEHMSLLHPVIDQLL